MPRHVFTQEERVRGGRKAASMQIDRACPLCGKKFSLHSQYAGHLGLHSYADRYCGGDLRKAMSEFSKMGAAATDPFPQNGAFAEGHKILARFK